MRSRFLFFGSFAVLFILTAVTPRIALSSDYLERMFLSHRNPPDDLLTILDAAESPGAGTPAVGRFLSSS